MNLARGKERSGNCSIVRATFFPNSTEIEELETTTSFSVLRDWVSKPERHCLKTKKTPLNHTPFLWFTQYLPHFHSSLSHGLAFKHPWSLIQWRHEWASPNLAVSKDTSWAGNGWSGHHNVSGAISLSDNFHKRLWGAKRFGLVAWLCGPKSQTAHTHSL